VAEDRRGDGGQPVDRVSVGEALPPVVAPLGSPVPNLVGAIHVWIGDGSDILPCLTRLNRCARCCALVLADDVDKHVAWHRSMSA
jgi:hypothetical protein